MLGVMRNCSKVVPTYTWVDLFIPEAERLADLAGILWDLKKAREFAQLLRDEFSKPQPNWSLVEPLSISAVVMYSRPFLSGLRLRLDETALKILTREQREAHNYFRSYRDKHVAHSVNIFEENTPRADYCVERVKEEGITGISYGTSRIVGLSSADLEALIDLTRVLEVHVEGQISVEQDRLLPIVRGMSLDLVLSSGQHAFTTNPRSSVTKKRKQGLSRKD